MHAHGAARIAGAPSSARRSLRSTFGSSRPVAHRSDRARRPDARRASEVGVWDGHDARRVSARASTSSSSSDASNRPSRDAPWALMGRSVHEHHVTLTKEQQDELALGSVADASGVPLDNLRANLARLERLCPPLARRRARGEIKPTELARLALDLDAVATAMLRVKRLLPDADAAEMCAARPALFRPEDATAPKTPPTRFDAPSIPTLDVARTRTPSSPRSPRFLPSPRTRMCATRRGARRPSANSSPRPTSPNCAAEDPSFSPPPTRARPLARGGHAAGLEVGRGYGDGDGDGDGFVPGEWRADGWHVADSAREMRRRVAADCDVDRLLTDFPNILAMDVPALFEDLRRVFPDKDPGDVLRRDPRIATRVRDDPIRSSTFPLPSDSPTFHPLAASSPRERPRPLVRVLVRRSIRETSQRYRRGLIPSLAADVAV